MQTDSENKNARLFSAIIAQRPPKEKMQLIIQYLDEGVDIDFADDADNSNTPLHVAAIKGEVQIFKLLLDRGADATIVNEDNLTVLDILQLPDTPNGKELLTILYKKHGFQKRSGTSGVRGELYETKLLCLIVLRALCDDNTKEFILGSNLDGIGAFDDIVVRYKTKDSEQSKIIFLQAKHKENEILTVEDLLNPNKEISLHKYFQSYLSIRQKFVTDNDNVMFQGAMKNIDCKYILYTSAKEYFTKNKNAKQQILIKDTCPEVNLIKAGEEGQIFKFICDTDFEDLNIFVSYFTQSHPILLAKTLTKFILKENTTYKHMMLDVLIKKYHIFLAQNVICIKTIESTKDSRASSKKTKAPDHCIGEFRQNFLTSNEENLRLIRREISKELGVTKGLANDYQKIEAEMKSLTFKLPLDFRLSDFQFSGSEKKQQSRLDHLCSIFQKLFEHEHDNDSNYIYVRLDEDTVGPDEIVQSKDLDNHWLGGLVGNLLINDEDTEMLKFNLNEETLSKDSIKILQRLKENKFAAPLNIYRFDINFYTFPKLTLNSSPSKDYDRKLVRDFLSKVRIYTNQAKEDEVENVLKYEICKFFRRRRKQPDSLLSVKCDTIFLKVHDKIQKWWQQPSCATYLTETCKFYEQVQQEILDNPLSNIIHFHCYKRLKNSLIEFNNDVIHLIQLNEFKKSDKKIMIVVTDEINFCSLKFIHYLDEINKQDDYLIIDLDYDIIEYCLENVKFELESLDISILIVLYRGNTDTKRQRLNDFIKIFNGKLVIITYNICVENLIVMHPAYFLYRDETSKFSNLKRDICKMILDDREVNFQGELVTINKVLIDASLNLLSPNLLYKIIQGKKVEIGKKLTDVLYEKTVSNFIKRTLCRCITLTSDKKFNDLCIIRDDNKNWTPQDKKDIVLITESKQHFEEFCKIHNTMNVHWFREIKANEPVILWIQSHGSLEILMKCVDRAPPLPVFLPPGYRYQTKFKTLDSKLTTIKDTQEKVVIISAEPGMGKSTLLTHLAINTKRLHPDLWVLRINLVENNFLNRLSDWKDNNSNINLKDIIIFLYSAIDIKYHEHNDIFKIDSQVNLNQSETNPNTLEYLNDRIKMKNEILERLSKLIEVNSNNEIYLSDCDDMFLRHVDLSEIKLFNYFYNNNNLAILFDGFDEICPDFANEVIQLLCNLKTSKVAYLWITSRPYNVLTELELALGTFCFVLNPLMRLEQLNYLRNAWSQKIVPDETIATNIMNKHIFIATHEVFTAIADVLDVHRHFTSLPLHLYMIAEIYEDLFKDYLSFKISGASNDYMLHIDKNIINLTSLYEKFTKKKFEIQFAEKNPSLNSKDPFIRKIKQDAYQKFADEHKMLAAYLLLNKTVLSEHDLNCVRDFIKNIKDDDEKIGIIKCIVGDEPKFVHSTFTEYFAVEFIFEKLKSGKSNTIMWDYLLDQILCNDEYGIHKFINSKLRKDQAILADIKSNAKHITTMSYIFLAQFKNSSNNVIREAIEHDSEHIALFLIKCAKLSINEDNLRQLIQIIHRKCDRLCIFCIALISRRESIIKCLMELVTDIDRNAIVNRSPGPTCVSLNSLLQLEPHTIDLVVELLTNHHNEFIPSTSAHWELGQHGFLIEFCQNYLLKLSEKERPKLLSVEETEKPVHCTTGDNDCDLYTAIVDLLRRGKFKTNYSMTSDACFKPIISLLKHLLYKVYDRNNINLIDFVYNKLPRIQSKVSTKKRTREFSKHKKYHSKFYNLVLLRSLVDNCIQNFILTSYSCDMCVHYDVIMRYKTNDTDKSKMIFIQQPDKDFLVEDFLDVDGNFYLLKYLRSFLEIKEKFVNNNEHDIFQGPLINIDWKFIVHTKNSLVSKKLILEEYSDEESFIKINRDGRIFRLSYEDSDVENLVSALTKIRASNLAKTLSTFILRDNFATMMENELIKKYHAFLVHHVIKLEDTTAITQEVEGTSKGNINRAHCLGRFKSSFLTSADENLVIMRHEIRKKIEAIDDNQHNNVEAIMESLRFKLPINFGKQPFCFYVNEVLHLSTISSIFQKLFKTACNINSNYIFIKIDDDSVGPEDIIQIKDLVGNHSLAELVGNLLIIDEETEMFKFNLIEETLSNDSIKMLKLLKETSNVELSKIRLDICIHSFPQSTLNCKERDRKSTRDFLNRLKFYSNRATDEEIECTLKKDINLMFNVEKKQNDDIFRIKCDAIFLSHLRFRNENNQNRRPFYSTAALNWKVAHESPEVRNS